MTDIGPGGPRGPTANPPDLGSKELLLTGSFDDIKGLDNKVAKVHRIAISAFVETAITLASCVGAVLFLSGAPVFLPCIITGIALTISAIYMASIYYKSRKRYPAISEDSLDKVIFTLNKSINDSINNDFSHIINQANQNQEFAAGALASAYVEDSLPDIELLAKVDEAYKRNEESQVYFQQKFHQIKEGFERQHKRLQKGHPALIDEVTSELYQRNALLKIISFANKATSLTWKLSQPNSASTSKEIFNNYKDLIGFQKLCFNWFDIGFKYQRCYLRDQEIAFLRFYINRIQSLIQKDVERVHPEIATNFRQKFLEPLSYRVKKLEKSNQQKKKKQIIAGITSSIESIEVLVSLGKNFLNPQKHAKTIKVAERTSSSLSLFGSMMSFGLQIRKISHTCKQTNNVESELHELQKWQKRFAPLWRDQLPPLSHPVWNDWRENWSGKLSNEEYFVGMESMKDVISARIDVLKATKAAYNRKTTYNSFKMVLTTSKTIFAAKDVLEIFGLVFIHLSKAFAIANLAVSLAGLTMQLGNLLYKFWKGRHTIKYYRSILSVNSRYRKNRTDLIAKEKMLASLNSTIEQKLTAGQDTSKELRQIERLVQGISRLEAANRKIKQDLYKEKRAYKDSLLQECFYSYNKKQVQELTQKLSDFPFRAEDSNFKSDNKPHELIVAKMRELGVFANNLGKKEILNFIRK